jgi:hypothetical protein
MHAWLKPIEDNISTYINNTKYKPEIFFIGENNLLGLISNDTNSFNKYRLINYKIEKYGTDNELNNYFRNYQPLIWLEGIYVEKYSISKPSNYCELDRSNERINYSPKFKIFGPCNN